MKSAYDVACAKLAARMRTEKEIRDFLGEKEYEKSEIDEAITDLKEFGYIDDKRYAVEYFRYAKKKSKAEAMIFRELAAKGIAAEFARDAIEDARTEASMEADDTDEQVANRLAVSMLSIQMQDGKLVDDKFLARVARRLASKGFSANTVYSTLADIKSKAREML